MRKGGRRQVASRVDRGLMRAQARMARALVAVNRTASVGEHLFCGARHARLHRLGGPALVSAPRSAAQRQARLPGRARNGTRWRGSGSEAVASQKELILTPILTCIGGRVNFDTHFNLHRGSPCAMVRLCRQRERSR